MPSIEDPHVEPTHPQERPLQSSNRFAFKEWGVICAALDSGRQSLILRKGGIHEGRDGFRVEHREFWLFPTEFHQQPGVLTAEAQPALEEWRAMESAAGMLLLRNYVVVEEVIEIRDESLLPRLLGLHLWSEQTLHDRFHYRAPGLFALLVRVHRRAEPLRVPQSPHFAGCRSWVDFPADFATNGLTPVLSDETHLEQMATIRDRLRGATAVG